MLGKFHTTTYKYVGF